MSASPEPPGTPGLASRVPALVILLLCATLTVMAGATIAPSLPGIAAHFETQPGGAALVPMILTVPGLAIAIAAPLAGLLADRTPKRRVLLTGIAVYVIAGSSGLYLDTIGLITFGRLFLGVAVGAIMTSAMALIADLFDDAERGRILGYQAAAMSFGGMSFIMAGGFLADLHWRGPFAVYLAPLLLIPFIFAWVPYGPPAAKLPETDAPKGAFPWAFTAMIGVAAFANFFTYFTIPLKLPFMLRDMGIESATLAGSAIALLTFSSGIVSLGFGRISTLAPAPLLAALAFLIASAGYALLSLQPPVPVVFALMVLIGCASGIVLPNATTWLYTRVPPAMRGQAAGLMTMAVFTAQFLAAPFVLLIDPLGGIGGVYMTTAFIALLTALFYIIVDRRLRQGDAPGNL
ncbi:MAG: MFS transporter [Roseitalea sp.]|jgi:MFS family permease|nr:MFS transporter [Roseitalea sp.]MBO6744616.1 MFS transporter [Roseitalea sp.]